MPTVADRICEARRREALRVAVLMPAVRKTASRKHEARRIAALKVASLRRADLLLVARAATAGLTPDRAKANDGNLLVASKPPMSISRNRLPSATCAKRIGRSTSTASST